MIGLPEHLRRSLTWDRDTEMARYDKIQLALEIPVYFCDPHARWQRGSEESTSSTCHLIVQQTRVLNCSVCRGPSLSSWAMVSRSAWVRVRKSSRRGRYWRSSPFVFSLLPRCQGDFGSQN